MILGGAVIGVPGGSAQREYEKRSARDRTRRAEFIWAALPRAVFAAALIAVVLQSTSGQTGIVIGLGIGVLILIGQIAPRMTTEAWSTGSVGEVKTAQHLDPLAREGFVVMHDLRISMSTANIDHLVIGPTGVFVVETKNIKGDLKVRGDDVFIGGRRVKVAVEVEREVDAVWNALGSLLQPKGIQVSPLICSHRADLPLFRRTVAEIPIVYPNKLAKAIRNRPTVLSAVEVAVLRARASRLLPPRVAAVSATSRLATTPAPSETV